jgi:hypothetical protein
MRFNTGLVVGVLVAACGLAVVDPWYGLSTFGGAAVAGLALAVRRRATPAPDGAERARETVDGLYSTRHLGGQLPVEGRRASYVELETTRYMGAADGGEEELHS